MNIVESPTTLHLKQVYDWLVAEDRDSGQGFLCNWEIIQSSFDEGYVWFAERNSVAIAFLVWHGIGKHAGISILEVHPSFRRKRIGKALAESILNKFKMDGVRRVKIHSKPTSSEPFWLSLGFREDEEHICERINGVPKEDLYLYKQLS